MAVSGALKPVLRLGRSRVPNVAISLIKNNGFATAADSNILNSTNSAVDIPKISLPELMFSKMEKYGNIIASECPITGRKYTYDQYLIYAENFAGALRKKFKYNKADVVAVLMPNSPEFPIVTLGIMRAGLIATTMNPLYTPEEISRQLEDSGAKAIITVTDLWQTAKASVNLTKRSLPILTAATKEGQPTPEGAINLKEVFQEKYDVSDIEMPKPSDIAAMPYSSGTTGLPKGVEVMHSNLVSNICQLGSEEVDYLRKAENGYQEAILTILPQFHIYGLVITTFLTSTKGARHVSFPKFEPKLFIESLVKYKPNSMFVAPPLVIFMTSQKAVKPEYLVPLRTIISGAAPLGASDEEKFREKVNNRVCISQGYGMTETATVISLSVKNKPPKPGSAGFLLSQTQVKIADLANPQGPALGPNQSGEILVKGPQVMKGYHNKPKETTETFIDGWLRTGDIGFHSEDGSLTISDRLKELIKVKGFQVPPAELEEVIRSFPDILEVGVIGIPHERYGEVPRAYVTVKPGVQLNEEKLQDFVKSKVANYKELRGGVSVVDAIPKNASGKILRRQLLDMYHKTS